MVARLSPRSDAPSLHPGVVSNREGCTTSSRPGCSEKYAKVVRSSPKSGAPTRSMMSVVSNEFGSRKQGQEQVKKSGHDSRKGSRKGSRLHFGTWNIGFLTERLAEVGEVMKRRKVHVMCLQETKWVGDKAKVVAPWGCKLWYTGKDKSRNGVGIVIDKDYIDDVVEVSRKSDMIMSIKLLVGDEALTVISAYAPQVGLDVSLRRAFGKTWKRL
ncbi:hypothetical protein RND81_02G226700 [Saponaria officinalis]|uniref:Endonuclease/exonuclease/phosphatase domain-containing protein n=1 Tax=Saponaria officinalis TaxID=3572 RepID=A0AAW1MWM4_SAPOF